MRNKLLLSCLLIFTTTQLFAYDVCVDGIYYNLAGDSAQVTFADEQITEISTTYAGLVSIPDEIVHNEATYRVTEIGPSAFAYSTDLIGVQMGANIHRIGLFAFNQCPNLGWISLGENLLEISAFAFYNCALLSTIELPASLQTIGNNAFAGCVAFTQVNLPAAVKSIGTGVWAGCSSIIAMQVDPTNTYYQSAQNCILHTASKQLVAGCRNSTIPQTATSIADEAFSGCTTLTQVIVPDNVTEIGAYAFAACEGLTTAIISNSVEHIAGSAFAGCSNVVTLNIPSKVQTIGPSAFAGCSSLRVITIPVTISSIGAGAFAGCTALERLSMPATNDTYHSINNCIVNTSAKELVVGCKHSVIPNDGSIIRIGDEAFAGCATLEKITLPDALTSIGDYAFSGCEALQQLLIPSATQTIGIRAFADCVGLNEIYVEATTPPAIATDILEGVSTDVPIIVPCASFTEYQASAEWSAFSNLSGDFAYTITVTTTDEKLGTVTVTQQPDCSNNTTAIFEAIPAEGCAFVEWSDGNFENPRTVIVDEDLTFTATFIKAVTHLELDSLTLSMKVGNAHQLTATVFPEDASNKNVLWESDNEDVVEVIGKGWIVAKAVGQANVTAITEEGNYAQTCVVTVSSATATGVENLNSDQIISVRKVLENGTLYIIRTNPETGREEKYVIDGRKIH